LEGRRHQSDTGVRHLGGVGGGGIC